MCYGQRKCYFIFKIFFASFDDIPSWPRLCFGFNSFIDQKTDVVVFGTKHKLPVMKYICITVGGSTLSPSSHVRNLGVIFDSTLTMTNHISTICRTAYMHLHNISRIRRYLTPEATKSLVHAFSMPRLDYGNALLAGLPLEHLKKLQRIQNIAARIITFTPRRDHITPILKQLHWLPIKRRIEFKILLHVFRCINGMAPPYLADMLKRQCSTARTRSSQQLLPRTCWKCRGQSSWASAIAHSMLSALDCGMHYRSRLSASIL